MKNVRQRLRMLELMPQFRPPPCAREQIMSLALQSLSLPELEILLHAAPAEGMEVGHRQLSQDEAITCAAAADALEREARRAGFRSFTDAERGRRTGR
jgi:hypothetical protein